MTGTDHDAERGLIGLALMSTPVARRYAADGLAPEHMGVERHRAVWRAVLELLADGVEPDPRTVAGRIPSADPRGTFEYVDALTADAGAVGNVQELHRRVRDAHRWRARHAAARQFLAAVDARDEDAVRQAETALSLAASEDAARKDGSPEAVARRYKARLDAPPRPGVPFPFPELTEWTGGMRPGQITFLSGPTKHGKSVFADMVLEHAAVAGATAALYMNEMSEEERVDRIAARHCAIPMHRLVTPDGRLHPSDRRRVDAWLDDHGGIPFRIEEAEGWTGEDVARDLLVRRPGVAVFDLLDEVPLLHAGASRRETGEETFRRLKQAAMTAGTHLIVVGHLNRQRAAGQNTIPLPVLGDVRESAMYAARSHNLIFVWREQDEDTGHPSPDAVLKLDLARQGRPGALMATFEGEFQRFSPRRRDDGLDQAAPTGWLNQHERNAA